MGTTTVNGNALAPGAGGTADNTATLTSFAVDTFSGDGVQTAFTLTATPTSENNVLAFVAGARIPTTQYSVSGTTLTFDTPPAAAANNVQIVTITLIDYAAVSADVNLAISGAAAAASALQMQSLFNLIYLNAY